MALPPISPLQAAQLGVAAHAAGSAAASVFSDLLRSAADFLKPAAPDVTSIRRDAAGPPGLSAGTSDVSVLSGQIESLLSRIGNRVRELVAADNRALPAGGLTLCADDCGLVDVPGAGQGPALSRLLTQDDVLGSLLRSLGARLRLRDAATASGGPGGPLRLQVDDFGARTVTA